MHTSQKYHRASALGCLLLSIILLSGCLTRKNAIQPSRAVAATSKKGRILTDATTSPKNIQATNRLMDGYAEVLGVAPNRLETIELYRYIDNWMGTPHRTGGSDHRGLDCSAFVGMVMRDVYGKSVPRVSKDMADHVKRKYERQLREGDLLFFSFGRRGIDHVGIYLQNNKFVHVSTSKEVIISDLHDPWYYKYFKRAGAVK